MRRRTAIVTAIAVLVAAAGGALALSPRSVGRPAATPQAAPPPVPVVAETVKSGDVPIYLTGIG